jgi:tetratricopeptide (TPR) repeat protein
VPARSTVAAVCLWILSCTSLHAQTTVAELNEAGWKMLDQRDGARASKLFSDALALRPDEPVLLYGASVAAHLQGRASDARRHVRRALEVNPHFTPASLLLGELAYRDGDLTLAIETYASALAFSPGNRDLSTRLQQWRQEADVHSSFVERRQDRFRVMFEGHVEQQLATRATTVLTDAFWRIGGVLGAYPSDVVGVTLYTAKQFRDITRAPEWSGGIYDGRIRVPAAGAAQKPELFERVLAHELTHAMIVSIAPRGVPTWLHEGLAQHFEGADPEAARRRLRAHGQRLPLERLEGSFMRLSPPAAQVAYDESLVAVSLILHRSGFTWTQLLNALAGADRADDVLRGFGFGYADLDAALR